MCIGSLTYIKQILVYAPVVCRWYKFISPLTQFCPFSFIISVSKSMSHANNCLSTSLGKTQSRKFYSSTVINKGIQSYLQINTIWLVMYKSKDVSKFYVPATNFSLSIIQYTPFIYLMSSQILTLTYTPSANYWNLQTLGLTGLLWYMLWKWHYIRH